MAFRVARQREYVGGGHPRRDRGGRLGTNALHRQRGLGPTGRVQLAAQRAFAYQHHLQSRAFTGKCTGGFEQLAQSLFNHQPPDVDHQLGVVGHAQRGAGRGARRRLEQRRVATVGDRVDPRRVGAVVAHGKAPKVATDHQQPLGTAHHGAGQATADRVTHANIGTACPGDQREARAARGKQRAVRIRVQPVRKHEVRREAGNDIVQHATALPSVKWPRDQRQGVVGEVAHVATVDVAACPWRAEEVAARTSPCRIHGSRTGHLHRRQAREFTDRLQYRAAAVGFAGNREL